MYYSRKEKLQRIYSQQKYATKKKIENNSGLNLGIFFNT